jgi:hypothetical protein
MTRSRVIALTLSIFVVLVATLPACGGICCPPSPAATSLHAQMPCCSSQTSVAPRPAIRVQPGTFAGSSTSLSAPLRAVTPVIAAVTPAPLQAPADAAPTRAQDSSPPLFLRHAQLLI